MVEQTCKLVESGTWDAYGIRGLSERLMFHVARDLGCNLT